MLIRGQQNLVQSLGRCSRNLPLYCFDRQPQSHYTNHVTIRPLGWRAMVDRVRLFHDENRTADLRARETLARLTAVANRARPGWMADNIGAPVEGIRTRGVVRLDPPRIPPRPSFAASQDHPVRS